MENPRSGYKATFRPSSLHDKFTYLDEIQPANEAPNEKLPKADPSSGSPAGAIPFYPDVSREESLYDLSQPLFPWRPSPDLPVKEARSLVQRYRLSSRIIRIPNEDSIIYS